MRIRNHRNDHPLSRSPKHPRRSRSTLLPFVGLLSLIWFLFRVIPKPSRAFYPCQRVAFPLASGFVIWLVGLFSSIVVFKKLKKFLRAGRVGFAMITLVLLLGALGFTFFQTPSVPAFAQDDPFVPTDPPNTPMGTARGIFPGRVIWAHNIDAASWNGSGYWSDDKYTDQAVVDEMLSQSLRSLTGTKSDAAAWDALFRFFNIKHGKGNVGYETGETIAIKLNLNACNTHKGNRNRFYSSPQGVLAMLQQLVENAGVDPQDITFFDATRFVPKEIYEKCKAIYPSVVFADWEGGDGRAKVQRDLKRQIMFSQKLNLEPGGGNPVYVPSCVAQADYLIDMGQLKGHNLAGVTLCAKNYFGAIMSYPANNSPQSSAPKNAGLHPYICVHSDFHFGGHWDFEKRDMGTYNPLVDLLGYEHLGAKTMLFFVDGLYSAPDQSTELKKEYKWKSFGNEWPNSIFISQDPVAVESVCLDFLRNESVQGWVRGNVDNYLHEAAMADNPPSGTVYDPEQDGIPLKSLGVHEHWNNAADRQYSRNLGTGDGIELIKAGESTRIARQADIQITNDCSLLGAYPNPFNAQTLIRYTLPQEGFVQLNIYALSGKLAASLVDGLERAGVHETIWKGVDDGGRSLASGVYFAFLRTEKYSSNRRITLLK